MKDLINSSCGYLKILVTTKVYFSFFILNYSL